MDSGLAGKSVFVSGGSRGIGLATARAFLGERARVAIAARGSEGLEAAHTALAESGGALIAVQADMTQESDIARALDAAEAAHGRLDAVVANVGSGEAAAGFSVARGEWLRVIESNLLAGTLLAGQALARLAARGRGSLTFVSSIAGIESIKAPATYAAAKAALNMAMKAFAQEAGPLGVRVNAVAPGNVLFPGGSWERKLAERRDFFEAYVKAEVALQRFARPEEIAEVVLFLASDRASFVTGAVWPVDGGQMRSL